MKKVTLHAERNEIIGDKALIYRYEQTVRSTCHIQDCLLTGRCQIAEMTAYIAQLETTQSVPATPRRGSAGSTDDSESLFNSKAPNAAKNTEVAKAREDRAKLLGYIVNAGNLDEKRNDEAPRPVSPVKPVSVGQLPYVSHICRISQRSADRMRHNSYKSSFWMRRTASASWRRSMKGREMTSQL